MMVQNIYFMLELISNSKCLSSSWYSEWKTIFSGLNLCISSHRDYVLFPLFFSLYINQRIILCFRLLLTKTILRLQHDYFAVCVLFCVLIHQCCFFFPPKTYTNHLTHFAQPSYYFSSYTIIFHLFRRNDHICALRKSRTA